MVRPELNGKVALVTGSSHGLGRGMALALAAHGADLVLTSRKLEKNEELADEIRATGRRALALKTDAMVVDEIRSAVRRAVLEYGRIDVLVNNAGTNPIRVPAVEVEEWAWDKIIDTNLKGVFFFAVEVARHMMERRKGKIINIASAAGAAGSPLAAPYGVTKAGVIQLTRTLAIELAPYNINVNAIGPSFFEVGMSEYVIKYPELKKEIVGRTPLRRLGRLEDLTGALVFLASDSSDYVTGQTVFVDGGWTA